MRERIAKYSPVAKFILFLAGFILVFMGVYTETAFQFMIGSMSGAAGLFWQAWDSLDK